MLSLQIGNMKGAQSHVRCGWKCVCVYSTCTLTVGLQRAQCATSVYRAVLLVRLFGLPNAVVTAIQTVLP